MNINGIEIIRKYSFKQIDAESCIFQGIKLYEMPGTKMRRIGSASPRQAAAWGLYPTEWNGLKVTAWGWSA